jgi:hypothetical protein
MFNFNVNNKMNIQKNFDITNYACAVGLTALIILLNISLSPSLSCSSTSSSSSLAPVPPFLNMHLSS